MNKRFPVRTDPRSGPTHRRKPSLADRAHERQLQRIARRPRAEGILAELPDAIASFDREWRYVYVNRVAAEWLQRPASSLLGQVVWEVYPEVKELMVYTLCLRALETQESFIFEEYEPPLGRWLEQRVIPSEHGVTIIGRDLTAWRNVTSDLARLEREVAERDTRLRQLVVERMASELSTAPSQVVAPDSDRADAYAARRAAAEESSAAFPQGSAVGADAPNVATTIGTAPARVPRLRACVTLRPEPGARDAIVACYRELDVLALAIREARCLSNELQLSAHADGPILITSLWACHRDYLDWCEHPARIGLGARLQSLVAEAHIEHFEVVLRGDDD